MDIIRQNLGENSYQILVDEDIIPKAGSLAREYLPNTRQAFVLTNTTVGPLYGQKLVDSLEKAGIQTFIYQMPDGEDHKNFAVLNEVYDALLEAKIERQGSLWALGGGVVGDLGGFAAATYLRGIAFVQVPTSLLAQVDSSVGGKVAVNHPKGKNLIGAFYQPSLVLADLAALNTLPEREWQVGLAEIVKYGVLAGGEIWQLLVNHLPLIKAKDPDVIRKLVVQSIKIKADVVEKDERESGLRMILNLGHTIGHGLEAATGYKVFRHGEAVAIGLVGVARLAARLGRFSQESCQQITSILARLGLPVAVPQSVQRNNLAQEILGHLSRDKKVQKGEVRFVLPVEIGKVEVGTVPQKLLEEIVRELCGEAGK